MNNKKDFLFRLLRFMIGQSAAAVGASLMIGSGVALVQLADVGMSSNDLLPLLFFEMQHKFQFRTVRILYDAVQCVIGLFLGGIIGVSSVVSLVRTGPIIQATVGLLRKCGLHERNR